MFSTSLLKRRTCVRVISCTLILGDDRYSMRKECRWLVQRDWRFD